MLPGLQRRELRARRRVALLGAGRRRGRLVRGSGGRRRRSGGDLARPGACGCAYPCVTPAGAGSGTVSSAARRLAATARGSAASVIARTTAARGAPAAVTAPIVASSIPPMANHGRVAAPAAYVTRSRPTAGRPGFVGVAWTGPTPR